MSELKLLISAVFYRNNHGLQHAALATIDCRDAAAGGSREENPGVLFIFEQRLAFLNGIAFLH
ncbi:hypothetical protein D3C79_986970 [compost metagenome]